MQKIAYRKFRGILSPVRQFGRKLRPVAIRRRPWAYLPYIARHSFPFVRKKCSKEDHMMLSILNVVLLKHAVS